MVQQLRHIAQQRQVNSHAFLKGRGLLPRANCVLHCENLQMPSLDACASCASLGTLALTKDGSGEREGGRERGEREGVNDTGELTKIADTNAP